MTSDAMADVLSKAQVRRRMPSPEARRLLRTRSGLTQDDLARALGVNRATVSRWEAGRNPRATLAARYLELMDRIAAVA